MTIRNLNAIFKPRSVALIGASERVGSLGAIILRNLLGAGFSGPVYPVNPKYRSLQGQPVYASVDSLPETPDLAVICTPPRTVPKLIEELGIHGTRGAVVITAGFGESKNSEGPALQQAMLDAAKPHLLRIIGPNCLGALVPGIGLNASFAHLHPAAGNLAFVAQSGAILTSIIDWAQPRNIGFSHLVSLGGMCDVDFDDLLDFLANDAKTQAILLYIEAVTQARKFMSAARASARMKPVIVVKAGRHPEGAKAAASHTGALAGSDAVYEAAFRRAGLLRVDSLEALFDAAEILAVAPRVRGRRMAIVTNGGGLGVLATDALMDAGGALATLSEDTIAALDKVLPATWSHGNPVDIIGDAPGSRYAAALLCLFEDRGVDAILALNCPTAVASSEEAAQAVIDAYAGRDKPLLLTSWAGEGTAQTARRLFAGRRIPSYATPDEAVRAFMYVAGFWQNQEALMETPPSLPEDFSPDVARAGSIISSALREDREWLSDAEAKALLACYGIPIVPSAIAATPAEAARIAAEIGGRVALKIRSPDITHKSDVGGVALGLVGAEAVEIAAQKMLESIQNQRPQARLEGFFIQAMIERPEAYELIAGIATDVLFGPVILFGQGGIAVELLDDRALSLPPLNMRLALDLMARTRIQKLLQGFRNRPPADLNAIALCLIKVAQIAIDLPAAIELDINPLLADAQGILALDARIKIGKKVKPGTHHLAILPYPKELEQTLSMADGKQFLLRPILPEDELPLRVGFFQGMTAEEIRLRFFVPMKQLNHMLAARFTQIDYDREMVLVLTEPGIAGKTGIYAVVQLSADPDGERAEFSVMVRHDMGRRGLGSLLMKNIIGYARGRGIREIVGDVLPENTPMLKLARRLGFEEANQAGVLGVVRVRLRL
jgi:acetyltransferase